MKNYTSDRQQELSKRIFTRAYLTFDDEAKQSFTQVALCQIYLTNRDQ